MIVDITVAKRKKAKTRNRKQTAHYKFKVHIHKRNILLPIVARNKQLVETILSP